MFIQSTADCTHQAARNTAKAASGDPADFDVFRRATEGLWGGEEENTDRQVIPLFMIMESWPLTMRGLRMGGGESSCHATPKRILHVSWDKSYQLMFVLRLSMKR